MDQKIVSDLKLKYKRVVAVEVGGRSLAFKPFDRAKLTDLQRQVAKSPELRVQLSLNAIGFCCVHGSEYYDEIANEYPLALVGGSEPGVLDALMSMARGNAQITIEE